MFLGCSLALTAQHRLDPSCLLGSGTSTRLGAGPQNLTLCICSHSTDVRFFSPVSCPLHRLLHRFVNKWENVSCEDDPRPSCVYLISKVKNKTIYKASTPYLALLSTKTIHTKTIQLQYFMTEVSIPSELVLSWPCKQMASIPEFFDREKPSCCVKHHRQ